MLLPPRLRRPRRRPLQLSPSNRPRRVICGVNGSGVGILVGPHPSSLPLVGGLRVLRWGGCCRQWPCCAKLFIVNVGSGSKQKAAPPGLGVNQTVPEWASLRVKVPTPAMVVDSPR